MGGARRPRIPVGRATEAIHEMGVAQRLQDWGAHGPRGRRNGGHTVPEVAGFVGKGALT